MTFARERAQDILDEILPLLKSHYDEIAHFKDIPLEPDFEKYLKLEELDGIRVYTARDENQKLIGYSVFFLSHNIHYKSSLQAVQDVLFIHPSNRGSGAKFILWCDDQLKKDGVQAVYQHVKAAHNFGPLLERFGYQLVDLIYSRRLD